MTARTTRRRSNVIFRSLMNDLKRDDAAAAADLGVSLSSLREVLSGAAEASPEMLRRAAEVWPVSERDFLPLREDAEDGVVVMRDRDAASSARIIQRRGRDYYEYFDSAMSRLSRIRPEKIRMMVHVEDSDAENPAVCWNKGHFLYQFTYFVGDINYYYEWKGRRYCAEMRTGDSVYGLPYAPHSFTTRDPACTAYILAITFGGRLAGEPQLELNALGPEQAARFSLHEAASDQAALLRAHAESGSYTVEQVLSASGLARERMRALWDGSAVATDVELRQLSRALETPVRQLMPEPDDTSCGVRFVRREQVVSWLYPDAAAPSYRIHRLAHSITAAFSRGVELEVLPGDRAAARLEHGMHEFAYNHGSVPIVVGWSTRDGDHATELAPGDSMYCRPFVPHWFRHARTTGAGQQTKILLLRAAGTVWGDAWIEARRLGERALRRVADDDEPWYDATGGGPREDAHAQSDAGTEGRTAD